MLDVLPVLPGRNKSSGGATGAVRGVAAIRGAVGAEGAAHRSNRRQILACPARHATFAGVRPVEDLKIHLKQILRNKNQLDRDRKMCSLNPFTCFMKNCNTNFYAWPNVVVFEIEWFLNETNYFLEYRCKVSVVASI